MRSVLFRRSAAFFLSVLLLFPPSAGAISTSAQAAVLMDEGGRVLWAWNAYTPLPIASTTKLMTALVVVERTSDLDVPVTVPREAQGVEGSSMYLAAGERLTLRDLLYGLLLHSGNDAAVALAILCAGDVDTFVGWMNDKALALGMEHSHFMNPNGLDAEGHYSSPYDMALLAAAVLRQPALAEICATKTANRAGRAFTNHNKLLWRYEGCVGLKTGYTDKAGRTLVSAARREGTTLIAVTLHDPNDWSDHAALLDYGFAGWHGYLLAHPGKALVRLPVRGSLAASVPVVVGAAVSACLTPAEQVTARVTLPDFLEAPVAQGQEVGTLTFYLDGQPIGTAPLLAAYALPSDRPGGLSGLLGRTFRPLLPLPEETAPLWRGTMTQTVP